PVSAELPMRRTAPDLLPIAPSERRSAMVSGNDAIGSEGATNRKLRVLIGAAIGASVGLAHALFVASPLTDGWYVPKTWVGWIDHYVAYSIPWALIGAAIGLYSRKRTPRPLIASPKQPTVASNAKPAFDPNLSGIGGWLLLMALGQILGPLRFFVSMGQY